MNINTKYYLKEYRKGDEPERIKDILDFGRANNCIWTSSSRRDRMLHRRIPIETKQLVHWKDIRKRNSENLEWFVYRANSGSSGSLSNL